MEICKWTPKVFQGDDFEWLTECKHQHYFIDGGDPIEVNGFVYCPFCGKRIEMQ